MADADKPLAQVVVLDVPEAAIRGHRQGTIVRLEGGQALVDYPGNPHGPLPAMSTVVLDRATSRAAVLEGRPVLLSFLEERSDRPVVVGLLHEAIAPVGDLDEAPVAPDAARGLSASVDGRRVTLEAQDEVVLRCGDASITLRRNGRLVIRGVFVETHARGTNRIKGGTVQIN